MYPLQKKCKTIDGEVEGTWETRLPTSLTVIQAGSIGLNVQGLPCNSDCEDLLFDSDGNPIDQTNSLIGDEGVGADVVESSNTVQ